MTVLVDSQTFLWVLNNPELIGKKSLEILQDKDTELLVSAVSIWELGLKYKKKKQPYSIAEMLKGIKALNASLLLLEEKHLKKFEFIDLPHKDPFDTLLVAQSEAEHCVFITSDRNILKSGYPAGDASK